MEAVNYLIVSLDKAYENEVKIVNGDSIIVNSTIEEVAYINRVATVVAAPSFTVLKAGDKVVVHHNIFRLRNSVNGNVTESNFHIEGNQYFVPLTEVFMYKREDDWEALDPYCFVEPIDKEQEEGFSLSLSEGSYKGKEKGVGIIRYVNKNLSAQGVKNGDKVKFTENSEYEFNIDGVLYYKMSTRDIIAVV
jgi:co-chaperonin GroES (HSP10)